MFSSGKIIEVLYINSTDADASAFWIIARRNKEKENPNIYRTLQTGHSDTGQ